MDRVKIDISTSTILRVVLVLLSLWFLYVVRDIAVIFFVVLVIVAALSPIVEKMSKYVPRALALVILLLVFLGVIVGIGYMIVPLVILEIGQLASNWPVFMAKLMPFLNNLGAQDLGNSLGNYQDLLMKFSNELGNLSTGIYTTTVGFVSTIVAIFTILILSFYMLLEENELKDYMDQNIPIAQKDRIFPVIRKIGLKMGDWFRGQLSLMIIIGILDGIALLILGVPYALVIAIWGGLTEGIPYIGPFLGMLVAGIVAYTVSPLTALFVIIVFIIIQQLENQFLVPKIMGKAVGLSPVIIILALLVGAKLMGVLGMIIAVPVSAVIWVLIQEWSTLKKAFEKE